MTAGVDVALSDLWGRRAGSPLWRLFGGRSDIGVYASGLNPEAPGELALRKRHEGFRAFKLKVGFGRETDLANLRALRATLGEEATLMVDANQAWDIREARAMGAAMETFRLVWLEEPIRADAPLADWRSLSEDSPIPLATGENIRGNDAFSSLIESRVLHFLQPDLGKWGGFTGCIGVGRGARGVDRGAGPWRRARPRRSEPLRDRGADQLRPPRRRARRSLR